MSIVYDDTGHKGIIDEAEKLADEVSHVIADRELSVIANMLALMMAKCAWIAAEKTGHPPEVCLRDMTDRAARFAASMQKVELQ